MIIWFKPEVVQIVNWAGEPKKLEMDDGRIMPRKSFAQWQEQLKHTSSQWSSVDMKVCREFKQIVLEVIVKQAIKSKQEAKIRQKKQEEFVDTICHEIRNPINGIIGSLHMIQDKIKVIQRHIVSESLSDMGNADFKSHLQEIEDAIHDAQVCADHQTDVANDVLTLSKLDNNKLEIDVEPFNANQEVRIVCRMVMSQLKKKNLKLDLNLPEESMVVKGDSFRLRQVLVNLLTNAIKFTDQGSIKVSYEAQDSMLKFTVSDTGIGMTKEEQLKLFQPFSQANTSISSQYGGTGLGLSISRQLVNLMGGTIAINSERGKGTTFSFTIKYEPMTADDMELLQESKERTPTSPSIASLLNFKKVLVVDNNEVDRRVLVGLLIKNGFVCEIASDGPRALELFSSTNFNYVLLALNKDTSGVNGFDCIRSIREFEKSNRPQDSLPVPIFWVDCDEEKVKEAITSGVTDFVERPYEVAAILQVFAKYQ
ncbi:hybrid histidine kinase/receptor [Acrasis kona]|uniref:Hybrid histidine kinase/receptor n=1 Tax=Acrasis kona TaxID=1008807 RepID=A0AAW2Z459_9EUKA